MAQTFLVHNDRYLVEKDSPSVTSRTKLH